MKGRFRDAALGESLAGMTIQVYLALIASLLITLWSGRKATKRTFEMFCWYFAGWASAEELQRQIDHFQKPKENSS